MFSSKDLFFTPTSGAYTVSKSLRFRSSATAYLSRTFGTPTDNKKFYLSCCLKRGSLGSAQTIISSYAGDVNNFASIYFDAADKLIMSSASGGTTGANATTSAVFRDPSAWYLLEFLFDSTLGTAADRTQIWVNGVRQTVTGTNVPSNAIWHGNTAVINNIGRAPSAANYADFYLAETNGVDGQSLTLPLCGAYDTNGIWQPKAYTGSYGNNGFYLKYTTVGATSGSNTGYGQDFSGNGNYWTTNNFGTTSTSSTYDSMLDSPTNATGDIGNYCVLNSASIGADATLSEANLTIAYGSSATRNCTMGTIGMSSGKWYWEITVTASSTSPTNAQFGISTSPSAPSVANYPGFNSTSWGYYGADGNKYTNSTGSAYGNTFTTNDVIGVAFDADNGKLYFSKNNTWQNSGDPAAGTNAAYTSLTSGPYFPAIGDGAATATYTGAVNFGQRPFAYTPPSGYSALNTQNLSTPTITNGAQYMAAVLYTGTGSSQTITASSTNSGNNPNGTTFQPDLVWVKGRSGATDHALYDAVRGVQLQIESNTTTAETTETTGLTAFTSSGFTTGALAQMNTNTATYVAWEWNAGGSNATNTTGTIQSTVRANTSAGFSVVTYTGTLSAAGNATVGHGLGVAPSLIISKSRSAAADWCVQIPFIAQNKYLVLNTTVAQQDSIAQGGGTLPLPNSTTFGTSYINGLNISGQTFVAYCFAPVAGYSAFGSYTGNGSADGPFVYCGFRPRWVLYKRTDSTGDWAILDTSRSPYNVQNDELYPNSSIAETAAGAPRLDSLSNGFKIRNGGGAAINASGGTYIYAAFAENPFKISRAR